METMDQLAIRAKTDKASNGHNYTKPYSTYLDPIRLQPLVIFELGIGGYQYPDRGGESLNLWADYFPNATIVGIDCYEKNQPKRERVHIIKGSQDDRELMARLVEQFGQPDLIIDDASHICSLTVMSFAILFPMLKPGGLYFAEDLHVSFWPDYGGNPEPNRPGTSLKFFQDMVPQLSQDSMDPSFRNQYAGYVEFIHFYRNLAIIKKA